MHIIYKPMKFRFNNLRVNSQCLLTYYVPTYHFVDKDDSSVKSRDGVLLPYQEVGLSSPAPTKFNDAKPAERRLSVGMWQIYNVLSKPSS